MTGSTAPRPRRDGRHSVGEPVGQAGAQPSRLVRQEVALAKEEPAEKGRRADRGGGLLGAAGTVAYAGVLFAVAGLPAATGRA